MVIDGASLKTRLRRAERRNRVMAFLLVLPLLAFIVFSFVIPILDMLMRSVNDPTVSTVVPKTATLLEQWNGDDLPDEAGRPPRPKYRYAVFVEPTQPAPRNIRIQNNVFFYILQIPDDAAGGRHNIIMG